ncbi:ABC transporter ATP-binding protein [Polyangium fumosum]|nr:ATP-binding cassette domain-containing protein [Polyangium fumosum]
MPSALEARDIRVIREGRTLVDGASLVVSYGEKVAIAGPSGSGKSTFLRAMATLIPIDSGHVLLDGVDAIALPPTRFRTRIAYLPQAPPMLPGTVADNVAAGPALRGETLAPERQIELLRAVGLDEAFLTRGANELSGGERQRVALARALANEPKVLLLDEPTAALDPETALQVIELVRSMATAGRGVVMVTHIAAHAEALSGRRYVFQAGKLVAVAEGP